MAPQSSGNGPEGAHPPITRSPMAQEKGMCVYVCVIRRPACGVWPCLAGGIVKVVSLQGVYRAQYFLEWSAVCVRSCVFHFRET